MSTSDLVGQPQFGKDRVARRWACTAEGPAILMCSAGTLLFKRVDPHQPAANSGQLTGNGKEMVG